MRFIVIVIIEIIITKSSSSVIIFIIIIIIIRSHQKSSSVVIIISSSSKSTREQDNQLGPLSPRGRGEDDGERAAGSHSHTQTRKSIGGHEGIQETRNRTTV